MRAIADVIGQHLDLPVTSIVPEEADEHFGWLAGFLTLDVRASSALTRKQLGWRPSHPELRQPTTWPAGNALSGSNVPHAMAEERPTQRSRTAWTSLFETSLDAATRTDSLALERRRGLVLAPRTEPTQSRTWSDASYG